MSMREKIIGTSFFFQAFVATAVAGTNVYVSATGTYVDDEQVSHPAWTDLQAAIEAAGDDDTVWVESGFLCASGQTEYATGYFCRLRVGKSLTLRSRGGDGSADDAPVIRGAYAAVGATGVDRCGDGAMTCVRGKGAVSVRLIGFRLETGATTKYANKAEASGGGAYGVTLENCRVTGCAAYYGGGVRSCDTVGCTFVDCHAYDGGGTYFGTHDRLWAEGCSAAHHGGGASGTVGASTVTNCTAAAYGGGLGIGGTAFSSSISDSAIVDCRVTSNYGGGAYNAIVRNCKVRRCTRGALANCKAYDCELTDNADATYGAAFFMSTSSALASNCTFRANGTPVVGANNGGTGALIVDCTFEDNRGTVLADTHNNVVYTVRDSTICCTNPAAYAVSVVPWSSGTSPNAVNVSNCVIVGSVRGCGDYHNCLLTGNGRTGLTAVSCDAAAATHTTPERPLRLFNCTVTDYVSSQSAAGATGGYVDAYNTVFFGNTSLSDTADSLRTARNCRLDASTVVTGEADANITDAPLFIADDLGLPHPSETSPCRRAGSTDYVFSETDLAGNPRLSGEAGSETVAIGACEFDPTIAGAEISCQAEALRAPANGVFSASVSGLGSVGVRYYWDFDGDGKTDAVTDVPFCAYAYPEAGAYVATLLASNAVKGVKATYDIVVPEGFFVSSKEIGSDGYGVYVAEGGYRHPAYTNLQQAVDAASSGDIVWIDADFVCDAGSSRGSSGPKCRVLVTKPLTLRGQTGDGRTGPVIRGAFNASGATGSARLGDNAVACVRGNDRSTVTLIGLCLENGATASKNSLADAGGGGASLVTLRNCLVKSCAAYYGGGVKDADTFDCEFRDCYAANYGGAVYEGSHSNDVIAACRATQGGGAYAGVLIDSVVTNSSASYGGAVRGGSSRGCLFADCTASNCGGATYQADLVGCTVTNCNAAASYGGRVRDCLYVGNRANDNGSAYLFYENAASWVSNCVFAANAGPVVGSASALSSAVIEDSCFSNNLGTALLVGCYNLGKQVVVRRCVIRGTPAASPAIKSRRYNASVNLNRVTVVNSEIEGAVVGSGDYYNCLIAGGKTTASQAMVFCDEAGATYSGTTVPLTLVNCTVASNVATKASGGCGGGYAAVVNSIIRENVGTEADVLLSAQNSCLEPEAVVTGARTDCTDANPRFARRIPGRTFVPRANALRGTAHVFAWMSDPDDPRSVDLAGRPRVSDGAPDMGAFEMYPSPGLLFTVR